MMMMMLLMTSMGLRMMNNHACIFLPTKNTRPDRQPQHLMIIKKSVKLKDTSSCDPILKPRRATVISLTIWEKKSSWKPWKCMKSPQNKPESLPGTWLSGSFPRISGFGCASWIIWILSVVEIAEDPIVEPCWWRAMVVRWHLSSCQVQLVILVWMKISIHL